MVSADVVRFHVRRPEDEAEPNGGRREVKFTYVIRNGQNCRSWLRPLDLPCAKVRVRVHGVQARDIACDLPRTADQEDLRQEGFVGLLEAAARFEPDRDVLVGFRWSPLLRTTVMAEFYFADDLDTAGWPVTFTTVPVPRTRVPRMPSESSQTT